MLNLVTWRDYLLSRLLIKSLSNQANPQFLDYLKERHIPLELATKYQLGFLPELKYNDTLLLGSVTTPIFHTNSTDPIMIEARSIYNKKYTKITDRLEKPLYALFNIKDALNYKEIIIVEGVFDALSLLQYIPNVVATLSASLSFMTMNLLSYFDKIYLLFDNDATGIDKTLKFSDFFAKYYPQVEVETLTDLLTHKDANEQLTSNGHLKSIISYIDNFNKDYKNGL